MEGSTHTSVLVAHIFVLGALIPTPNGTAGWAPIPTPNSNSGCSQPHEKPKIIASNVAPPSAMSDHAAKVYLQGFDDQVVKAERRIEGKQTNGRPN
jgi:hypothetical protein